MWKENLAVTSISISFPLFSPLGILWEPEGPCTTPGLNYKGKMLKVPRCGNVGAFRR